MQITKTYNYLYMFIVWIMYFRILKRLPPYSVDIHDTPTSSTNTQNLFILKKPNLTIMHPNKKTTRSTHHLPFISCLSVIWLVVFHQPIWKNTSEIGSFPHRSGWTFFFSKPPTLGSSKSLVLVHVLSPRKSNEFPSLHPCRRSTTPPANGGRMRWRTQAEKHWLLSGLVVEPTPSEKYANVKIGDFLPQISGWNFQTCLKPPPVRWSGICRKSPE